MSVGLGRMEGFSKVTLLMGLFGLRIYIITCLCGLAVCSGVSRMGCIDEWIYGYDFSTSIRYLRWMGYCMANVPGWLLPCWICLGFHTDTAMGLR